MKLVRDLSRADGDGADGVAIVSGILLLAGSTTSNCLLDSASDTDSRSSTRGMDSRSSASDTDSRSSTRGTDSRSSARGTDSKCSTYSKDSRRSASGTVDRKVAFETR